MRDEEDIFKEWYEKYVDHTIFPSPLDPLDYIYLHDSCAFQAHLLKYRFRELMVSALSQIPIIGKLYFKED